ncbi:MAG: THUMP domain-containing protein [Nitrosopumilus sp.]|nr:THUMP domain-containing protein [Nitrosopumilus sp.]NNL53040.1 RNA methyltransferase [Nitrosopumilus sp.]
MKLIVTCPRHFESETGEEISKILENLGDSEHEIFDTGLPGIISIETLLDSTVVINEIREKIREEPWKIRYLLRIIPIQSETETELNKILKAVNNLIGKFEENHTYRITVEKRHANVSSKDIISTIANSIKNKVSLENPDWIILVEVLGNRSGISVLKSGEILSVMKEKRKLSE